MIQSDLTHKININPIIQELAVPAFKLAGKIKKFDKKLYDKYDVPARAIIQEKLGKYVSDNPDIYKEDMLLNIPDFKYKFLELQVCTAWLGDKYPYTKPYIYERKKNFSEDTLYIIFSKNFDKGLLFSNSSIEKEPRRLKKHSRSFVYDIPWYRILQFNIADLDLETILLYNC
jgi:hypothetical protein